MEDEGRFEDKYDIRVTKRERFGDCMVETLEVCEKGEYYDEEVDEEEPLFTFEKYEIYQRALDFANDMYDIVEGYPDTEKFCLVDQLKRASVSISNNLAEGFGKYSKKDKQKFYRIARSSVLECVPALTISKRRKYVKLTDYKKMRQECHELSRRISGLIKAIENRDTPEK